MSPSFSAVVSLLFYLPVFIILSVIIFYLPGYLFLGKSIASLRKDEIIVLSYSLGIVILLLQTIVVNFFHITFLSVFLYFLTTAYGLKKFGKTIFLPFLVLIKEKFLVLLILIGVVVEGLINFPSGFLYSNGYQFWSSHGHDGLWHIAVIEELKRNFPPDNLIYAGEKLFNYHYFIDIVIAGFNQMFSFFSSLDLYFRFFTFLITFLIGLSVFSFLYTWCKNKTIGFLGTFISYFVGSFGYLVLAVQHRGFFGGETLFWVSQGNTMIGNPPQAICFILLPVLFLSIYHFLNNKKGFFLIALTLGAFLSGFKVYAAIVVLAGLTIASLYRLFFSHKKDLLLLSTIVFFSNLLIILLISKNTGAFFIFEPWWFIRTMVVVSDRLNWIDLEFRRQFYVAQGGIRGFLRVLEFETIAFLIFIIGNLGTRIIGLLEIIKVFKKNGVLYKNELGIGIFFMALTGIVIPLFFVQKGVAYNLIQIMQFSLLLFGFFAAISLNNLINHFKNKGVKIFILIVFIILSIPTVIGNLLDFYGKPALAVVSNDEIAALKYLKQNVDGEGIILTKLFNPYSKDLYRTQPLPIYSWDSTSYISAFSAKQTYLTDEGQVSILGIDSTNRKQMINDFFDEKKPVVEKIVFLNKEKIAYIYLHKEEYKDFFNNSSAIMGLKQVFENDEVVIFKVN